MAIGHERTLHQVSFPDVVEDSCQKHESFTLPTILIEDQLEVSPLEVLPVHLVHPGRLIFHLLAENVLQSGRNQGTLSTTVGSDPENGTLDHLVTLQKVTRVFAYKPLAQPEMAGDPCRDLRIASCVGLHRLNAGLRESLILLLVRRGAVYPRH